MENFEDVSHPMESEIVLYDRSTVAKDKGVQITSLQERIKAIRSVVAFWTKEEIGNTGWKSGKTIIVFKHFLIIYNSRILREVYK